MESNKNDNKNNGDNEHDQLQRSAQKRKLNELTNDEDKPAEAAGQEDQEFANSTKNREEGNEMDLEEFSQRNIQLEKEKAEVHEDLRQKMAEIGEMHKEMEEKSEKLAEKANQINALLEQLNGSISHQHQMPTEQEMKILSLETWFDWLGFVPRHQLGKIVPMIGDRKFGSIVQKFLHEYGEITFDCIQIVAPYEEDPSGHPRVRTWQNNCPLRFEMAETQMPANIKNFDYLELSYFDHSVLNFMQKFQQNGLLENVNLEFYKVPSKDIVQLVLCHILPLIKGIKSIDVDDSSQLVDFYHAGNSKEIDDLYMKMMEETRFLGVSYDHENLHAKTIDLCCRWLYNTARADGKPRMLVIGGRDMDYLRISLFIDRLKQDFLMATGLVTFFIRIHLPKAYQPQEDICLDNGKTKERFVTKMEEADPKLEKRKKLLLLISRYPLASTKEWIEENENEVLNWEFCADKTIYLSKELKVVPI